MIAIVTHVGFDAGESIMDEKEDGFGEVDLKEFFVPEYNLSVRRDRENSTLGNRYPIWYAACRHKEIKYELSSPGSSETGTQWVMLQSLSDPSSTAATSHPDLKVLPFYMVKYLQKFLHLELDLPVSQICMCVCMLSLFTTYRQCMLCMLALRCILCMLSIHKDTLYTC